MTVAEVRLWGRRIGAVAVQMGNMVGALSGIDTWTQLQNHNLRVLLQALEETP